MRLVSAMAHRSWCAETGGGEPNERLEFLGDAVLGMVVTHHIYAAYPELAEGELAKLRASVVNAEVLAEVARSLRIGPALLLGRGEAASGGREKASILADAAEAVIGAVYLDGGWESARSLVIDLLGERIEAMASGPGGLDYKSQLQELVMRDHDEPPRYEVSDEGPDHAKRFHASVFVDGERLGAGEGGSKKRAEQAAARVAWLTLAGRA